jgi:hypothetical protein
MTANSKIRRIAIAVAAFAALAIPASASAWTGNSFKSPSGNIICHAESSWVACTTLNNGNVVVVGNGYGYHSYQRTFGTVGYVLGYGSHWTSFSGRFYCVSTAGGMGCKNLHTGHGFAINRSGYRTW